MSRRFDFATSFAVAVAAHIAAAACAEWVAAPGQPEAVAAFRQGRTSVALRLAPRKDQAAREPAPLKEYGKRHGEETVCR